MTSFSAHYFLNFDNAVLVFILFDCTKTGSLILTLVILSTRLFLCLNLILCYRKNVLNVSAASFSLFEIALVPLFNVKHSLWKAFLKKTGLIVFKNFLLTVAILLFKFPK